MCLLFASLFLSFYVALHKEKKIHSQEKKKKEKKKERKKEKRGSELLYYLLELQAAV